MSKRNSKGLCSFHIFEKDISPFRCSTPSEKALLTILRQAIEYREKIPFEQEPPEKTSDSEIFKSFTSSHYDGDVSEDKTENESSIALSDSSRSDFYLSALSQVSTRSTLDASNASTRPLCLSHVSTIVYCFNPQAPTFDYITGKGEFRGISSTQIRTFQAEAKCYIRAEILKITPDSQDELSLVCMQCKECSQYCRLRSPEVAVPAHFGCPHQDCDGTLFNPVYNVMLTLQADCQQPTALLTDRDALTFFGVDPVKYVNDSEARSTVFTALQCLHQQHQQAWFCLKYDFCADQLRITQTSLLCAQQDKEEARYSYYCPELFSYTI